MGAAFVVALVLIYILVVWEFGNFRIPLVIMAPIPLTLLGIIPAHFLAFQLGLGGEFTATSMIGWIALAGIIVRNSILLVDFSIHEIQRGIPVAEAVIRACKTRTRPILITALALVAGSSVIFTDPIFQGMAISLASGVLVSTILTLIVIPLGCVAKSRDMCAVAAATAPPGVTVPCDLEESERAEKSTSGGGRLGRALGKIAEILMLVLYAIRGLALLLYDALKGLIARRRGASKPKTLPPTPPSKPSGPTAPPGQSGPPSGGGSSAPPGDEGSATAGHQSEGTSKQTGAQPSDAAPRKTSGRKPKASAGAKAQRSGEGKPAGAASAGSKTPSHRAVEAKGAPKRPSRRGIRLKDNDAQESDHL